MYNINGSSVICSTIQQYWILWWRAPALWCPSCVCLTGLHHLPSTTSATVSNAVLSSVSCIGCCGVRCMVCSSHLHWCISGFLHLGPMALEIVIILQLPFFLLRFRFLLFLLSLKQDCSIVQHYTVKTLAHLPSCISVTKECYQIGFLNWTFIEFHLLVSFFRRPIWLHSWHFYHKHAVKELSRGRCARLKKQ